MRKQVLSIDLLKTKYTGTRQSCFYSLSGGIPKNFFLLPFVLLVCFILQAPTSSATSSCKGAPVYCTPTGNTNIFGNGYVTEFKITDPSNNVLIDQIASAQDNCCAYIDNTGAGTPNLTPGVTYTIDGSRQDDGDFLGEPDPFYYGMNIWIDYNDDGTFNNTNGNVEIVYVEGLSEVDAYSFTYTVPTSGITAGVHRLRIRTHYNDANPAPCGNLASGAQGMDFLVNIVCSNPAAAVAGNDTSVCAGALVNLSSNATTGNAPITYSWCGPNNFSSTQQNPSISSISLVDSGTYMVTVTDGSGCNATASTLVTVNPSPTASPSSNGPLCSGSTLNLFSGGTGTGYSWTGPNGFNSPQQNPVIASVVSADSGLYTVVISGTGGCSATASINVIVSQLVTTDSASSNSPLCSGNALHLSSTSGAVGYSWTGPNGFTSSQQNPVITNVALADTGTYTVTITVAGGCSATKTTSVAVKQSPTSGASSNSPLCAGSELDLFSSGGTGYSWTGPNGFTSIQQNPSITVTIPADSGTYTVTVSAANGCTATSTSSGTINQLPIAGASANGPVCEGSALDLFSSGGASYSWTGPNGFTCSQQDTVIQISISADSGIYTVTVTSANNCTATATATGAVYPAVPTPVISQSGDTLKCSIDPSYTSYQWYADTSIIQGATSPSVVVTKSGNYNIEVSDGEGCSIAVGITITITGIPTPSSTYDNLVSLSPNPATSQLIVHTSFSNINENITLSVMNVLGEIIQVEEMPSQRSLNNGEYTFNIGNLPSGIYFLQLKTENGNVVKRFIKE